MQRGGIPVNMGEHKGGQARERWPPFSRTRIKEYQGSAIFSRWNRTDCYLLRRRGVVWSYGCGVVSSRFERQSERRQSSKAAMAVKLDQQLQGQLQAFAAKLDGGDAVATGFLIGVRGKAAVFCVVATSQSADEMRAHADDVSSRLCGGLSIVGVFAVATDSPPEHFSAQLHALAQAAAPDGGELLVGASPFQCVWSGKPSAPKFDSCLSQLRGFTSVFPVNVCLPLPGAAASRRAAVETALQEVADALRGGCAQPAGAAVAGFERLRIFSPGLRLGTKGGVCSTENMQTALTIRGHVHARAYVDAASTGSSFESAAEALREDLARTLKTRFALLADQAPLSGGAVQLPQRVLVPVGVGRSPQLLVSDYLLPGEALAACQQRIGSIFAVAKLDAASFLSPESAAAPDLLGQPPKRNAGNAVPSRAGVGSTGSGTTTKAPGGVPITAIIVAVLGVILAMLLMR